MGQEKNSVKATKAGSRVGTKMAGSLIGRKSRASPPYQSRHGVLFPYKWSQRSCLKNPLVTRENQSLAYRRF